MHNINEPWEAQLNWAEDCKRDSYVFNAIDKEIAGPISMDEATLIAAAPDLLEALEYVLTAHGEQLHDAFGMARAAIAKAKGE